MACVAVEICSAAFYLDDDPGVLVSACLVGDGAAATIWRREPGPRPLRCGDFSTLHQPAYRDRIRFGMRQGKLCNLLHPSVPGLAAAAVQQLLTGERSRPGRPPNADFSLPEGTTFDEQSATEFKGLAKELDLTQEQAQKLLDFGGAKIRAMTAAPQNLWAETQDRWQAEVKADPEIGGTKYDQSIKTANEVFIPSESNPFVRGPAEAQALRTALSFTGAGNNPEVVRLFVRMGKMLAEPGALTGNPLRDTQDSLLAKMYPTMS